jgi:acetolactate synthase-1/2/3 large subunit
MTRLKKGTAKPRVANVPKKAPPNPYYSLKNNMTVAQLFLEYLKLEGVSKVFGIPGATIIAIMNELRLQKGKIDFIICRQETGATYIADGYSRVTGSLGVVLTTSGPAASNALTGAINAQTSGSSLLTLTGEVPTAHFGQGYLQEGIDARLDIATVFANAVEFSEVIGSPSNATTLLQQALREARSIPGRATHISLPNDVASSCVLPVPAAGPAPQIQFPNSTDRYRTLPSGTDPVRTKAALADLTSAMRPLILLGNGSRAALKSSKRLAAFTKLVERFAIPVMTTPDAKGIFPETHDMSLRNYGMTACAWPDVYMAPPADPEHFDALVVLGSALGELATSVVATDQYSKTLIPTTHFIQVDLDQAVIGRDFPVTAGIVGEIGATIDLLCEEGARIQPNGGVAARKAAIKEIKQSVSPFTNPEWRDSTAAPLNPAALVRVINEVQESGHFIIDAGNCVGWGLNNMVVDPPLSFHSALSMGPMGFGVGAVIGMKLGAPKETCIALVGDGAFLMHGAEVSTAAQNKVGAIIVVLDDNDLAMVSQGMGQLYPPAPPWNDYYKLGAPNLAQFAQSLGADGYEITKKQGAKEFRATVVEAISRAAKHNTPQVIAVKIDTTVAPPYGWPTLPPPSCGPTKPSKS